MPSSMPLLTVIAQVVRHTPEWVWGLLLLLIVLGASQLRDHRLTRLRVALLPIGLGAYSAWGTVSLFGLHAGVLLAWAAAVGLAAWFSRTLAWAQGVRHDAASDRFDVPGSVWPLVLMLTVFGARYSVIVTLAFHRDWAAGAAFAAGVSAAYGVLTGLLAGRALYILGSAQRRPTRSIPGLAL
jgi:hypothetical protein